MGSRVPDWTIEFDALLCMRRRTCRLCGQRAERMELWADVSGEALALALCLRCLAQDKDGTQRDGLVAEQVRRRAAARVPESP